MPVNYPFLSYGLSGSTQGVAGSAVTTISLQVGTSGLPAPCVRLTNLGTVAAFINFWSTGDTVTVATTQGICIRSNTEHVFRLGGKNFVQMIAGAGVTTTVFATAGEGMPTT